MPGETAPEWLRAFGEAVRTLRIEQGLTQEQLAEAAGLHPRYVSDVERGRRNVGLVNIRRLALALAVDTSVLVAASEGRLR